MKNSITVKNVGPKTEIVLFSSNEKFSKKPTVESEHISIKCESSTYEDVKKLWADGGMVNVLKITNENGFTLYMEDELTGTKITIPFTKESNPQFLTEDGVFPEFKSSSMSAVCFDLDTNEEVTFEFEISLINN